MVGNFEDARVAFTRFFAGDWTDILSVDGTTRMVWLINGVVYKVQNVGWNYDCNAAEFDNINNMRDSLPDYVHFPQVSLFQVGDSNVIAMEYIEGTPMARCYCAESGDWCDESCAPEDIADLLDSYSLDSGGMNIIRKGEDYYIVDAG